MNKIDPASCKLLVDINFPIESLHLVTGYCGGPLFRDNTSAPIFGAIEEQISIEEPAAPSKGLKIFDRSCGWHNKVNFVDENNVMLGYSLAQDCCESADWFIADHISEKLLDNKTLNNAQDYVFDADFFGEVSYGETNMAIFKIVSKDGAKYIHIHNTHNGYYSHGFTFNRGRGYGIREGSL